MGTPVSTPFSVVLDDADDPHDVIDAVMVERFVAGALPAARMCRLERVKLDAYLLPDGVVPSRTVVSSYRWSALAESEDWVLSARVWPKSATAELTCLAKTDAIAKEVLADATRDACETRDDSGATVSVGFWHFNRHGQPERSSRDVASPEWPAIRSNYTARVGSAFDQLMTLEPEDLGGRLLLLHGPPGTGKTTALRSLAGGWRSWCDLEVVIDSEHAFKSTAYLMAILLGDDDDHDDDKATRTRWRMLVLEDCDELLRVDAKKNTGQSLARLLNVTDGFLGQGMRILVALTTNEPLSELHPALVRPGRCIAEVHVDRLSRSECARWLGPDVPVPAEGATLAELYARVGKSPVRAPALQRVSATYL